MKGLNPKQQQFAIEYAHSNNGTQSAICAGYSVKTAGQKASDLLKIVKIQDAVAKEKAKMAEKNDVTVEEIVMMHRRAYEVAIKVDAPNAMTSAAQNLAKLMGLITDKGQIEHSGGLTVNIIRYSDGDDD